MPATPVGGKQTKDKDGRDVIKVLLLGDSGVGKTSLMNLFVAKTVVHNHKATIGTDFMNKTMTVNGREVVLQIWDTAGQERFQSLGVAFYRGSDFAIIVFDVLNRASFDHLKFWRTEFIENAHVNQEFPLAVIGNKIDQEGRCVDHREASNWCRANFNIPYYECSAKENVGVDQVFSDLLQRWHSEHGDGEEGLQMAPITLDRAPAPKKKSCC